jgi:excisionase family DNA binding protein
MPAIEIPARNPFLTVEEVATLARVNRKTVLKWVRKGRIPPPLRRPGVRRLLWPAYVIRQWLTGASTEAL